jgi:hypothetical protein
MGEEEREERGEERKRKEQRKKKKRRRNTKKQDYAGIWTETGEESMADPPIQWACILCT